MAATDFTWGGYPVTGGDIPFKNTDSTDFAAGDAVAVDSTNVISGSQPVMGALQGTNNAVGVGFALEAIKQGAYGRVRTNGIAVGRAGGAITAGTFVGCAASGQLKTQQAANPAIGIALSTTTTNHDPIIVLIDRANNA